MRKQFFCFVLLLATAGAVQAQYGNYYYHRVGDTVEWKSEIGYYSWWEFEPFFENNLLLFVDGMPKYGAPAYSGGYIDSNILLQRFYTPTPLKIVGIAGSAFRGNRDWYNNLALQSFESDTNDVQEYFYIYDADSNDFTLKAQVPWSPFDPCRTLHIKWHDPRGEAPFSQRDSCCWYHPTEAYIPFLEYYFDSAIWVTDSFYVGGSFFGNKTINVDHDSVWTGYCFAGRAVSGTIVCNPDYQDSLRWECAPKGFLYRHKYETDAYEPGTLFYQRQWRWTETMYGCMMIYPIIEVDTTVLPRWACDPVANVQAVTVGTSATVTWDDFPNYTSVTLDYGLCAEPQSQWRTVDVTGSTLYSITGLQPSACYGVRIKAECDSCKKVTPWSPEVRFYTGVDTAGGGNVDTTGVVGGTLLAQYTYVVPNPARDEVRVTSSFSLREIEIWTVDGVLVYSGGAMGHEATVDVSWLRAGTYVMAVRTHAGTTHRRLVVAR